MSAQQIARQQEVEILGLLPRLEPMLAGFVSPHNAILGSGLNCRVLVRFACSSLAVDWFRWARAARVPRDRDTDGALRIDVMNACRLG